MNDFNRPPGLNLDNMGDARPDSHTFPRAELRQCSRRAAGFADVDIADQERHAIRSLWMV